MMESRANKHDLVIKVKHGDSLKRFTTYIYKNTLYQNIATLKTKIIFAFKLPTNTDFTLTYTDTDGDTVMLSDDEDLTDAAVKQNLNPLRISVQLKSNGSPSCTSPNGSFSSSLEEVFKSLPGTLKETISKVTGDLVSKATSGPVLTELLNVFPKLAVPETPPPVNNIVPNVSSVEPSKETKKSPQSDKAESSNARGGYNYHHRRGYLPNPPRLLAPTPLPLIPSPFSPICNRRAYEPLKFTPNNNNKGKNALPCPTRSTSSSTGHPYRTSDAFQDVHRGIICDGCDVTPIVGSRFKSIVREDYDLCSACFSRMGNEAGYIRIDKPDFHRVMRDSSVSSWPPPPPPPPSSSNNKVRLPPPVPPPPPPAPWSKKHPRYNNNGSSSSSCALRITKQSPKLESTLVRDVSVLHGTQIAPLTPCKKIWRMRNDGSVVWPFGTQLVWVGGDRFSSQVSYPLEVPLNGFPVNEEINVAVDFWAPAKEGRYISYWRLASPSGQQFGQPVCIIIRVGQPNNTESSNIKSAVNPTNNFTDYPVVSVPFSQPEPVVTEPVPPVIQHVPGPKTIKLPAPSALKTIKMPASSAPSALKLSKCPEPSARSSYPPVDLSPSSSNVPLANAVQVEVKSETEETLLKELDRMGFKQIDLNKVVLRVNKYDLEKSIEHLCGFSEWDPLLEELKEMGFNDKETNKKLLLKNRGSIEGAVMDLGEKAD